MQSTSLARILSWVHPCPYWKLYSAHMAQLIDRLPIVRPEVASEREAILEQRLQYILSSRATNSKPVKQVCKDLGISRQTYYQIIRRAGLQITLTDVKGSNPHDLEAEIKRTADIIASTRLALASEPGTTDEDERASRGEKEDENPRQAS